MYLFTSYKLDSVNYIKFTSNARFAIGNCILSYDSLDFDRRSERMYF